MGQRCTIHRNEQIVFFQTCLGGGTVRRHVRDDQPALVLGPIQLGPQDGVQRAADNADPMPHRSGRQIVEQRRIVEQRCIPFWFFILGVHERAGS